MSPADTIPLADGDLALEPWLDARLAARPVQEVTVAEVVPRQFIRLAAERRIPCLMVSRPGKTAERALREAFLAELASSADKERT